MEAIWPIMCPFCILECRYGRDIPAYLCPLIRDIFLSLSLYGGHTGLPFVPLWGTYWLTLCPFMGDILAYPLTLNKGHISLFIPL